MSYIVPRDKPKRCTRPKCRFMDRDTLDCRLQDKSWESFEEQYEHCPLIEVPTPHGRLIDADKIDYRNDAMHDGIGHLVVADNFMNGVMWINDCIDNAPTVIEAEGET